jgi:predicted ATPase/class 3 adenylate cyclase
VAAAQPSGTVTLVFTDIEGSTRLLERLGLVRYRAALAEHRTAIRDACGRHGGYEVHYEGDSFFYAFGQAADAVTAMRDALAALDEAPVSVRVGIHTGTPAPDPPKYVGIDVHRAARIVDSAHGGQIVLSRETVVALDGHGDLELVDLGEHRFKDIRLPERLYQLGSAKHPPLRSLYRLTLPVPGTPFLGREAEVAEVVARLADPDVRLLTLTGPGGTGKTRLALRAAEEASAHFPDGTTWTGLAPLGEADLVLPAILQGLGARDERGEPPLTALTEALLGRRALLVLDNAEHLVDGVADLAAALIAACPTIALLVTSRERLELSAETVWPVPTMSARDGEALFLARARAAGVSLDADDAICELCERLDRLPLAIELAAAQTPVLSPDEMLDELTDRLPSLATRARDVDERQRTIESTIAWSYDLLAPEEQRVLRALGVFAGGCTTAAAVDVTGASADLLEALVAKSLLARRTDETGTARYAMLETIRDFARRRLDESGDAGEVADRHIDWLEGVAMAHARAARIRDENALAALRSEWPNARAALVHCSERERPAPAHQILCGFAFSWLTGGAVDEGDSLARMVVAIPSEPSHGLGWSYALAGQFAQTRGEPTRAAELAGRAVSILEETGPPGDVAAVHADLGIQLADLGDLESAARHARRALEIRREVGEESGIGHALQTVAYVEMAEGDLAASVATNHEAVEYWESSGYPLEAMSALTEAGRAERLLGHADGAESTLRIALGRSLTAQDGPVTAAIVTELGLLAAGRGAHRRAVELLAHGTTLAETSESAAVDVTDELEALRELLPADEYERAWERGRVRTIDDARLLLGDDPAARANDEEVSAA